MKSESKSQPTGDRASSFYRWYVLALLTGVQLCHYIDRNVMSVVVEPVRREFALSDGQIGLLGGVGYAVAFALAGLPMGYLVDRVNRRNLLALILTAWSVLTAAGAFAQSFIVLLAARMGVGAAESGSSPSAMSILADHFGPERRSTALGIWYMSAGLGAAITFAAGGYIVENLGWRNAFLIAGAPGLVFAVLVMLTLREAPRGQADASTGLAPAAAEQAPTIREAWRYVAGRPAILHLIAGLTLVGMMTSAFALWAVSFFVRVHGMQLSEASVWIASALSFGALAAPPAIAFAADRIATSKTGPRGDRLALVGAAAALGSGILGASMALAPSKPWALALMCGWCGFMLAHLGPANSLLVSLLPARLRGTVVAGSQVCAAIVSSGVGPYIVGILSDLYGGQNSLRWAIATGMIVNLWAVVHFLLAARYVRRDAAIRL